MRESRWLELRSSALASVTITPVTITPVARSSAALCAETSRARIAASREIFIAAKEPARSRFKRLYLSEHHAAPGSRIPGHSGRQAGHRSRFKLPHVPGRRELTEARA